MTALVIIEGVVILLLAVLVAGLLRSHADILRALHDLGVGEDGRLPPAGAGQDASATGAHDLVGLRPGGGVLKLGVVGTGHDTLLAFLSSGCAACAGFWSEFGQLSADAAGVDARLVVVTKGPGEESESHISGLAPDDVPVVMSSDAWRDYQVPVTPYFVLVDGRQGRVVGQGAARDWEQVRSMAARASGDTELAGRRGGWRAREADTDAELLAAGITPGHPSLHHGGEPD